MDNVNAPPRYGEAYARTLRRLANRSLLVQSQAPLQPGSLWETGSPEYCARLDEIQAKVNSFLEKFAASPAYDFEDGTAGAQTLHNALDECVILYAMGGVDLRGVEASARAYVRACRRGESSPAEPPASPPKPGTYAVKPQPGHRLDRPAPMPEAIPSPMPRLLELYRWDDNWRSVRAMMDWRQTEPAYFNAAPIPQKTAGYGRLHPNEMKGEGGPIRYVQVYIPSLLCSYLFTFKEADSLFSVHQEADCKPDLLTDAWRRHYTAKK